MMAPNREATPPPPEPTETPAETTPDAPVSAEAPPKPTHGTLEPPHILNFFDLALAAGLVVLAFGIGSFAVRNSDFWLHAGTGKLIANGQYEFGKAPFTYAGADRTWVNHSWLFDLLVGSLNGIADGKGVVIVKAILLAILAFLLLLIRKPGQSGWIGVLCVGLALLASAPYLVMSPAIFSYLFLGATLYFLHAWPARSGSWKLPIAIGVLFWVWANCDQWFFLGPVVIAGVCLGEFIERRLPGDRAAERPDMRMLLWTLLIGVVVCMANPHHIHVWRLPAELFSGHLKSTLGTDPMFAPLFQSLSDKGVLDFDGSAGGNPVNAFAFAFLLILNVTSFVLNRQSFSWSALVVNTGMFALAVMHARALPFYAITAAAATTLNFGECLARLRQKSIPVGTLAFLKAGRVAVRLLLLVAGVAALAACVPGWLHPFSQQRRLAWSVEPDQSAIKAVQLLQKWRDDGQIPPEAHSLILNPTQADYCAWYAPSEKTYFDSRVGFHEPEADMMKRLKQTFPHSSEAIPPAELRDFLKQHEVSHVVVMSPDRQDTMASVLQMSGALRQENKERVAEWNLWDVAGGSAIFGWTAQSKIPKEQFKKMRYSAVERVRDRNSGPIEDPDVYPPPEARSAWDDFREAVPRISPHTEEAFLLHAYSEYLLLRFGDTIRRYQERSIFATLVGSPAAPAPLAQPLNLHAAILNEIRAARRGIAESPLAPEGYLALAQACQFAATAFPTPLAKQDYVACNLGRYFARLSPDQLANASKTTKAATILLSELRKQERRWIDLHVNSLKRRLEQLRDDSKARKEDVARLEQDIKLVEEMLHKTENQWLAEGKNPQGPLRDPNLTRAVLAMQYGLHGRAVESFKNVDLQSDKLPLEQKVRAIQEYCHLLMLDGQPELAQSILNEFEERHGNELAKPQSQFALSMTRNELRLALGQLKQLTEHERHQASQLRDRLRSMQSEMIVREALHLWRPWPFIINPQAVFPSIASIPSTVNFDLGARNFFTQLGRMGNDMEQLHFELATTYLLEGDNASAISQFREIIKHPNPHSPAQQLAKMYLELLGP